MNEDAFVETLPGEAKKWFAYALAGMVVADGQVTEDELEHLKETIRFLDNMSDVNDIVGMIKNKESIQLTALSTDRTTATKILLELATVAISDGVLSTSEVAFFNYLGDQLGFEPSYCEKVIKWGADFIQVTKQQRRLFREGISS